MAERGVKVDHSTIARWVVHYAPLLNQLIRREMRRPNRSWRVDDVQQADYGNALRDSRNSLGVNRRHTSEQRV